MVDLFSGFGGLSSGFEKAGFDVDVAADVEENNAATHEYNFSYGRSLCIDLFEDQTKALKNTLKQSGKLGQDVDAVTMSRTPDAVVGGPPCTAISAIGNRDPNDPRNDLMRSFIDHGVRLEAKCIVMENVPTLLQAQNEYILDDLRETLHRAGYGLVEPQVLRAVDFGVPQRRERVFLMAHRLDMPAPVYPQPTHSMTGDLLLKTTPTVAEAFEGLPDADDYEELWNTDTVEADYTPVTSEYGRLMRGLQNDADDLSYKRNCFQPFIESFDCFCFNEIDFRCRQKAFDPDIFGH